jgi:acetoin utilization deacetylase AcuC-like enzyme
MLRQLRVLLGGRGADLFYSGDYVAEFPGAQHDPRRGERVLAFLIHEGWIGRHAIHRPRKVAVRRLRRVHSDEYLEGLQLPGSLEPILGYRIDDALEQRFLEAHKAMVGGTLAATRSALARNGLAVNLGGGFHHALPDRGRGFCAFHDVAVAIAEARHRGFAGRVLVIDLDLHDGDGTRAIYARDERVHTLSIHNAHWDETEARESTSVALGSGVGDREYLEAVREHVGGIVERFRPDLAYYLAGCDPAQDDTLGDWRIGRQAMAERDAFVLDRLLDGDRRVPTVMLLAGGYGGQAWRYTAAALAARLSGGVASEPSTTASSTLDRYRRVAAKLRSTDLTTDPTGDDWQLTPEDILPALTGADSRGRSRFLGYYSRHGIELALERYGFLPKLRGLGFHNLQLEFDLDPRSGHTLRVFAGSHPGEPVCEIRLLRSSGQVPGMELLSVEWLLLQNPSASFTVERPRLPGQRHPGLGMLRDVWALLIMVCERLDLDGVSFVAGHYHLVVQSHGHLGFLDPAAEARFDAIYQELKSLPLAEATRLVDEGGLSSAADGTPIAWDPPVMILPVSERLKAWCDRARHAEDVEPVAIRVSRPRT